MLTTWTIAPVTGGEDRHWQTDRGMKAAMLLGMFALSTQPLAHPLDPLSTEELSSVAQIIRSEGKADTNDLFTLIALHEPPKDEVLAWKPGTGSRREGFAVVFDQKVNTTFEAIVDLKSRSVISWKQVPGVQPMWTETEDALAVELVIENADWQAAMVRRGITNFSEVAIATWMPGHYSIPERGDRRFFRTTFHHKRSGANSYGPPIEGVEAIVDLNDQKVVQVIDTGRRAIAQEPTDFFDARVRGETRPALKPLATLQPEGPSFKIDGNEIQWDRWRFRYAFHPREGLVLYLVRYEDAVGNGRFCTEPAYRNCWCPMVTRLEPGSGEMLLMKANTDWAIPPLQSYRRATRRVTPRCSMRRWQMREALASWNTI